MANLNTVIVNLLIALNRNLDKDIKAKIDFAGANTGNLIFTEGLKDQLNYSKEIWINPAALQGVKDPTVAIPSANFIIQGGDSLHQAIIRFLEQTDCPVTMIGLGAQAESGVTPEELVNTLTETQIKAFKMLAERAVSIGVRGEFSAQCLNLLGIKNIRVIGCPSFYFRAPKKSYKLKIPSLKRTQMTLTPGSKCADLLRMGQELDSVWLMQTASELPQLGLEQTEWNPDWEESLLEAFQGTEYTGQQIWDYMRKRAVIFFERAAWDAFYQENDITFAYGSRFHGNMAAFRNGIPALWIVHDVRTAELVNTLHLPSISYRQFSEIVYPEDMLKYCDYSEYERRYDKLYDEYTQFLRENKLSYCI